jgi:hypothetical protein
MKNMHWSNQRLKLEFAASSLSTQNKGVRAMTGWLGISTMYQNGVTCLPADCLTFSLVTPNICINTDELPIDLYF